MYITHKSQYPASIRDFTWFENVCNGSILVLLEIQPHATDPTRYAPDIIAITETRIKYSVRIIYNVNLQGYKFIHVDTHKNAGGVGLYVKNCIDFIILNKLQTKNWLWNYG